MTQFIYIYVLYCGCLVAQSRLTVCSPMNWGPQGPSVHRISRQEYWSELPFSSPGDLPNTRIEPISPALQADSLPPSHLGSPTYVCVCVCVCVCACVCVCVLCLYGLSQNVEYRSLCYMVGPYCLSVLYIIACLC